MGLSLQEFWEWGGGHRRLLSSTAERMVDFGHPV